MSCLWHLSLLLFIESESFGLVLPHIRHLGEKVGRIVSFVVFLHYLCKR